MQIEIKRRYTGAVLFSGEFGSMKFAIESAVKASANLRDANLYGANLYGADLYGANLYGADLGGADLRGAYLRGAYLRGADLRGAYLRGADLGGADLIDAGQDSRGYRFVGWLREGVVQIRAGCRNFALAEGRAHWNAAHANNLALRAECLAKLDLIEAVATARGWLAQEKAA